MIVRMFVNSLTN